MQTELVRGGLDADADIGQPAGHRRGDRDMRVFARPVKAVNALGLDARPGQQVLGQQPRPRARLAVDEAQARSHQVGEAQHLARIAMRHHQALGAAVAGDQLVASRREQAFQGPRECRRGTGRERGHVEARDVAAALGQRAQRVGAAGKVQVDVQALGIGPVAQQRQRQVVAGVERQRVVPRIEG